MLVDGLDIRQQFFIIIKNCLFFKGVSGEVVFGLINGYWCIFCFYFYLDIVEGLLLKGGQFVFVFCEFLFIVKIKECFMVDIVLVFFVKG